MTQHIIGMRSVLGACLALCASATAQVTTSVSLTASSFTVYEPVFVSVQVANATSSDVQAAMGARRVVVQRNAGGSNWENVDLFAGIAVPEGTVYGPNEGWSKVPANGSTWREILLRHPSVYAVPGNYRVSLQATIVDAADTETNQSSAWTAFTVVADQLTSDLIESDGILSAYQALFTVSFSNGEIPLALFDETALKLIVAGSVSPGVSQFVDFLRAQVRIQISGRQTTWAGVTQMLDEAVALLDSIDTGMYASPVGGIGSHAMYSRAWARWMRATTFAEFDAATAEYQSIPSSYPAAFLAVNRMNWSRLRMLLGP